MKDVDFLDLADPGTRSSIELVLFLLSLEDRLS